MIVKCTCGGLENCTRCYGSGEYTRYQDDHPVKGKKIDMRSQSDSNTFSLGKGNTALPNAAISGIHAIDGPPPKRRPKSVDRPALTETHLSCPVCPDQAPMILTTRLENHLTRKHRIKKGQEMNKMLIRAKIETAQGRAASHRGVADLFIGIEDTSPGSDPRDASKNIGYPVREASRYGSHPSHDSFDDESSAD